MKKVSKKISFIMIFSLILAVIFSFSAYAEGWQTLVGAYFDNYLYVGNRDSTFQLDVKYKDLDTGSDYAYNFDDVSSLTDVEAVARCTTTYKFNVKAGDVVTISQKDVLAGWFGGPDNELRYYSYAIVQGDTATGGGLPYKILYQTGWIRVQVTKETADGIYYSCPGRERTLQIRQDLDNVFVAICFDMGLVTGNTFSMNRVTLDISWGNPNSPERPQYSAPDDSAVDGYKHDAQKVFNDSAQGRQDAANLLSLNSFTTNISGYLNGLTAATSIFNLCFDTLTPFKGLIYVALALGFLSFVLSTGQMIIGKLSHNSKPKQSNHSGPPQRRDATSRKSDGVASHRPSRRG